MWAELKRGHIDRDIQINGETRELVNEFNRWQLEMSRNFEDSQMEGFYGEDCYVDESEYFDNQYLEMRDIIISPFRMRRMECWLFLKANSAVTSVSNV